MAEKDSRDLEPTVEQANLEVEELTFGDYTKLVVGWLTKNPW